MRCSGARPVSSAVTTRAAESGVHARSVTQRSQPGAMSRGSPPSTGTTTQRTSGGSIADVRRVRRQATHRPSGETATGPSTVWSGSSRSTRWAAGCPSVGTSSATSARRDAPYGSSTRQVVSTVDPSGVTSNAACSSAAPAVGVRSIHDRTLVGGRRREQPWPVRAEVVVPEPDRRALVQDRGHLGGRPGRPPRRVVVGGAGTGQRRRGGDDACPRRRATTGPASPPGRVPDRPGLPAGRGQAPQRRGRVVARRRRRGPRGEEQQVAARGEHGVVLAGIAAGQRPGRPGTRGVDLPQRGAVARAVGVGRGDRGDEPAAVGGEHEARAAGERGEGGEVVERRGRCVGHRSSLPERSPSVCVERGSIIRGQMRHGIGGRRRAGHEGTSSTLPVVRRPSRSSCARAACSSG